jgi:hypothetical protein
MSLDMASACRDMEAHAATGKLRHGREMAKVLRHGNQVARLPAMSRSLFQHLQHCITSPTWQAVPHPSVRQCMILAEICEILVRENRWEQQGSVQVVSYFRWESAAWSGWFPRIAPWGISGFSVRAEQALRSPISSSSVR